VNSDLKVSTYCKSVRKEAFSRMYLILKGFRSKDPAFLMRLFNCYVRPKLEYMTPVWSPHWLGDIDAIEGVLRNFTSRLFWGWGACFSNLTYTERLKTLKQEPLELRRIKTDLILVYKMIHKQVHLPFEVFFEYDLNSRTRAATLGHEFRLREKGDPANLQGETRRNFFSNRIVPIWNGLSTDIVSKPTLHMFKNALSGCNDYLSRSLKGRAYGNDRFC
jgi:hypothetical protein